MEIPKKQERRGERKSFSSRQSSVSWSLTTVSKHLIVSQFLWKFYLITKNPSHQCLWRLRTGLPTPHPPKLQGQQGQLLQRPHIDISQYLAVVPDPQTHSHRQPRVPVANSLESDLRDNTYRCKWRLVISDFIFDERAYHGSSKAKGSLCRQTAHSKKAHMPEVWTTRL